MLTPSTIIVFSQFFTWDDIFVYVVIYLANTMFCSAITEFFISPWEVLLGN